MENTKKYDDLRSLGFSHEDSMKRLKDDCSTQMSIKNVTEIPTESSTYKSKKEHILKMLAMGETDVFVISKAVGCHINYVLSLRKKLKNGTFSTGYKKKKNSKAIYSRDITPDMERLIVDEYNRQWSISKFQPRAETSQWFKKTYGKILTEGVCRKILKKYGCPFNAPPMRRTKP
jgi:hypothetical protein